MNQRYKKLAKTITALYICTMLGAGNAFAAADLNLRALPANAEPSEIKLQGGVSVTDVDELINLSLRNSDTRQVLRMLADKAGLNIIFHDSVSGTVTLDLVNVTLNKAFEYIMTVNSLRYWIDNETLIVASKDATSELGLNKQQIKPIKIKYVDAAKVAKFLNTNIFGLNNPSISSNEIAIINPAKNEVLLFGTNKDIALAKEVIAHLDSKPSMKTFKVNHMTSGKMASLLCQTVFEQESASGDNAGDGSGGGEVACKQEETVTADNLASFEGNAYKIIYYPDINEITLYGGTQEQLTMAENFITEFDKKQPQAYIELTIIELSEAGVKTLESGWAYQDGKLNLDGGYASMIAGGETVWDGSVGTPTGTDGGYVFSDNNSALNPVDYGKAIANKIRMLVTEDKGRILANPRIVATNNQESTINITSDYLSERTQTVESTPSGNLTTTEYTSDSAGIEITLTPRISPDGYVGMDIAPSYTTPTGTIKEGSNIVLTLVSTRELDLKSVRVKDGETLVLGGLIQENESKSKKKIPVLGDIPVIGFLFGSSTKDKTRTELIIMVTPKIIKDDATIDTI
ncbi:MAG: hypothetical protein PHV68_06970 [Candidatus Gastranaerophilales bacterium]|nr:hypothetical protein [Candidatus Gastranaerophilales bacterium]